MPSHKKGDKRLLSAWASYDWANSVYFLVISSAIFPLYYGYICAWCCHWRVASGPLASGLEGEGRMEEPEQIVAILEDYFTSKSPLSWASWCLM